MFICNCDRCKQPSEFGTFYSAVKCAGITEQPCPGLMLPTDNDKMTGTWTCDKCNTTTDYKAINEILEKSGRDLELERGSIEQCEK